MAAIKVLTVSVKPFKLDGRSGFGITSGKSKWNSTLYTTKERAQKVCDVIGESQHSIAVNVAYPSPFRWAKEVE